jgi:CubicO group peptidase (beta-lactamase class C family)
MSASEITMEQVDRLMQQAVSDNIFPGAVLLVSQEHTTLFFNAYGRANIFSNAAMTTETIFDLASLTKPLATSVAVMRLVEQAKIGLESDLGSILPQFCHSDKAGIQIKHLLYHTSGLPDYRHYYKTLGNVSPKERTPVLRKLLLEEPLVHPVGKTVLYSDVGFMVLRWVIEQVCGRRLDQFVAEDIYNAIELTDLFFIELHSPPPPGNIAATEKCAWRRTVLEGQVHDENAYAAGGVEGHAGLFGTAQGIHLLLIHLLADYDADGAGHYLFGSRLVRRFFRRLTNTDKALGFDMPSLRGSSSGAPAAAAIFQKTVWGIWDSPVRLSGWISSVK